MQQEGRTSRVQPTPDCFRARRDAEDVGFGPAEDPAGESGGRFLREVSKMLQFESVGFFHFMAVKSPRLAFLA